MTLPCYEVYAVKYAERGARRRDNFVGGDPHDADMPLDFYVWLIRSGDRVILVDTGFGPEAAARRRRTLLRTPAEALSLLGVSAGSVPDIVITHLHYDHAGTAGDFPGARFHLQDDEMDHATGRSMFHRSLRRGYEVDDVVGMVRLVHERRVCFHSGTDEIAPGVTVHRLGGHTAGLQSVRVHTRRGWVVLASDASHHYEHVETGRCFPATYDLGEVVDGYETLQRLADSPRHIIPGHDPLVMARYPAAAPQLRGIVARLDLEPDA